jgi:hypothetical protein
MKHLKSLLAIVMVLVIGVCLTGCVSKAEKEAANAEFFKWFDRVTIDGVNFSLGSTKKFNIRAFGPIGKGVEGYLPGQLTIYGSNQDITPTGLQFSMNTRQKYPVDALNYEFSTDINGISPEKLVIEMAYRNADNEAEPAKDVTLTYYFDIIV